MAGILTSTAGGSTYRTARRRTPYNWLGLQRHTVAATQALPAGKATIRFEFAYDGGGLGKGGPGTLFVNGKKVAAARIDRTQCCFFSADERRRRGRGHGRHRGLQGAGQVHRQDRQVTIELKDVNAAAHDEAEQTRKVAP